MKAYTLIEMLVALSLMVIVLLGGTLLFTQNLRTGGMTEVDLKLNSGSRLLLDEMDRILRFGSVLSLSGYSKDDCLEAAEVGLAGQRIKVLSISGTEIDYYLSESRVASMASSIVDPMFLNSADLTVGDLQFSWFCQSGISDKIKIEMDVSSVVLGTGVNITKKVSRDILLLNGSTN